MNLIWFAINHKFGTALKLAYNILDRKSSKQALIQKVSGSYTSYLKKDNTGISTFSEALYVENTWKRNSEISLSCVL